MKHLAYLQTFIYKAGGIFFARTNFQKKLAQKTSRIWRPDIRNMQVRQLILHLSAIKTWQVHSLPCFTPPDDLHTSMTYYTQVQASN